MNSWNQNINKRRIETLDWILIKLLIRLSLLLISKGNLWNYRSYRNLQLSETNFCSFLISDFINFISKTKKNGVGNQVNPLRSKPVHSDRLLSIWVMGKLDRVHPGTWNFRLHPLYHHHRILMDRSSLVYHSHPLPSSYPLLPVHMW